MLRQSVLGGGVRREHAEEVVGARRGAEQQEEPSRLQVGKGRDALQQGVVLAALLLQVLSHKSCGSEGGAKNDQSLAFRRRAPRPYPNIATLLGLDGGEIGGLLSRSVPDAGLALVELDSGASPQGVAEGAIKRGDPLGRTHDIRVVQKSKHGLTRHEGRCDISQRGMLGERITCRHEGVALLPALSLEHLMVGSGIVCPDITAGRAIKLAGKRQQRLKLGP